jgi:DNA polymerase-3 subunit alpha
MFSLHNHTDYSNAGLGFSDAINKTKNLIETAIKLNLSGIAITDHEILSASYKAQQLGKKLNFPVILGNEIYLQTPTQYEEAKCNYISKKTYYPHFILLAKDNIGHYQLRQLSSIAWKQSYMGNGILRRPTMTTDIENIIGNDKGHLIAQSACLGSFFAHNVLDLIELEKHKKNAELIYQKKLEINEFVEWGINVFGKDDFYIEIQPAIENLQKEQWAYNIRAVEIAKAYELQYIITTDSHYLCKEDATIHNAFLNSKDAEREVESFYRTAYLMSELEVREYLKNNINNEDINTAISNTLIIGSKIQEYDLSEAQIIPLIKLPQFKLNHILSNFYHEYEYLKKFAYSDNEQDKYLLYQIEQTLYKKIKSEDIYIAVDRINKELKELYLLTQALHQPMSAYYNNMAKIVELSWNEGNSLVGPNRGSTGGFFIAYLLDIIQINPIPLGSLTPYWRHISAERGLDLPDIDYDTEASKRKQILQAMKNYYGENKVINICTFGTLSSKTALQVAGRGLNIPSEEVNFITAMIPTERGEVWSLNDCLYGNEEKGRIKKKEFVIEVNKYDNLLNVALNIEGLIVQRGIHASGVLILNEDYTKHNACMLSPSGEIITQFELHDSEAMSALKYDFLTINSLDRIRITLDTLLQENLIEWQGSLKSTYNKYLHPEVLDYIDKEMWSNIEKIPSLFQFDSAVGAEAIKFVQPKSVLEMCTANSLMRLMGDGIETPLEQFVRYKNNINLWYEDMQNYGLNESEIEVLKSFLDDSYGLADSQERVMLLSMSPQVSNFTLKESNKLRKSIAKKRQDILIEAKKMFYEKGNQSGTRKIMLKYVWEEVFSKSFGYSFSSIHSYGYTIIALQEMNLYNKYPSLYWNTACLIVDAGANEESENNKSTNYGKVATAISNMQSHGVKIALPNINTADFGFKADIENNRIVYGLKGINGLGDDVVRIIILNRPYSSLQQFITKMISSNESLVKNKQMIQLIKAGCFDELENHNRTNIMKNYIQQIYEPKSELALRNINNIIDSDIIPEHLQIYVRIYNFKKYISNPNFIYGLIKPKKETKKGYTDKLIKIDEIAFPFYQDNFSEENIVEYVDDTFIISENKFKKEFDKKMEGFKEWIIKENTLKQYNEYLYNKTWNKYAEGTISKWEMDSLCFYYTQHELKNSNLSEYNIVNFFELPENPKIVDTYTRKGIQHPKFEITRIIGTILEKNKYKHNVTLLTINGVVNIKMYDGAFNNYDRQVSKINEDGSKTIVEKSWLSRGNIVLFAGYRVGNVFRPYRYTDTIYPHTVTLVESILPNGQLVLNTERKRGN